MFPLKIEICQTWFVCGLILNNLYFCCCTKTSLFPPEMRKSSPWLDFPPCYLKAKNKSRPISKSSSCVRLWYIVGCAVMSDLFVYHRAKLGYGLLSGEYSKPAPDPGDENGASEPRVRRNNQSQWIYKSYLFTDIHGTCGIYFQK